ncbi:hypothetical protein C8R45DRAFT_1218151 [Mycena sanguinolenta]|nr:hypothetical protein C8R45DRAFT_1218151 [Mycena sanguinolenta]
MHRIPRLRDMYTPHVNGRSMVNRISSLLLVRNWLQRHTRFLVLLVCSPHPRALGCAAPLRLLFSPLTDATRVAVALRIAEPLLLVLLVAVPLVPLFPRHRPPAPHIGITELLLVLPAATPVLASPSAAAAAVSGRTRNGYSRSAAPLPSPRHRPRPLRKLSNVVFSQYLFERLHATSTEAATTLFLPLY